MKIKIVLTIVILIACFMVVNIIEQKVAPNVAADLAVNQLKEDGSREDLRIFENAQNWLDPACYLTALGLLVLIWYEPVKKLIVESNKDDEDVDKDKKNS